MKTNEKRLYEILNFIRTGKDIGQDDIIRKLKLDQDYVLGALEALCNRGLVKEERRYYWLTPIPGMRVEVSITEKGKYVLDSIDKSNGNHIRLIC